MGNIRVELDRTDDPVDVTAISFGVKVASAEVAPAELRTSVSCKNDQTCFNRELRARANSSFGFVQDFTFRLAA